MLEFFKKQNPETLKNTTAVFIACDRLEPYTGYLREKRPNLFENTDARPLEISKNIEKNTASTIENIEENTGKILIDMRSQASYDIEHISGSICLPFELLRPMINEKTLPFSKQSDLVFICPV